MSAFLVSAAGALLLTFFITVRRDPRWTGNAFLLAGSVAGLVLASVVSSMDTQPLPGTGPLALLAIAIAVLSPLLVFILTGFLLFNGLVMMRREGRSLGNLLSLGAGVGLAAAVVFGLACLFGVKNAPALLPVGLTLLISASWVGFLFTVYLTYTLIYPRLVRRQGARYVVVHGSGLIRGQVPPLLRARVDMGIAVWRDLARRDPSALLIMSGGQGADEDRSEASAMGEYAKSQGVPYSAIALEDFSTTTAENLRNTRDLVIRQWGENVKGLAVTSSYHVLRTASLARSVGLNAQVLPARVAGYFWPSAFLREVIAIVNSHRVAHALVGAVVVLPLPVALGYAMTFPSG